MVLRVPWLWVITLVVASVMVGLITTFYIASVVDPLAHLNGLPVVVVNEDAGATVGGQHINIGRQVESGLMASPVISGHLKITPSNLPGAEQIMDSNNAYATVVIPSDFTAALLTVSGVPVPRPASGRPEVDIRTNDRAGTLGVGLATGFLQPGLSVASRQIGRELSARAPAGASTPATRALLSDPVEVITTPYRPLPPHSALGLSAFYIALLASHAAFWWAPSSTLASTLGPGMPQPRSGPAGVRVSHCRSTGFRPSSSSGRWSPSWPQL